MTIEGFANPDGSGVGNWAAVVKAEWDVIDVETRRAVGWGRSIGEAHETAASYWRVTGRASGLERVLRGRGFDPHEAAACCGYPIGEHRLGGPCPTEIDIARRWGYM